MQQSLICYCGSAVPPSYFPQHAGSCRVRYENSPISNLLYQLKSASSLPQLEVLLEELKLELTKTEQKLHPAPQQFRPPPGRPVNASPPSSGYSTGPSTAFPSPHYQPSPQTSTYQTSSSDGIQCCICQRVAPMSEMMLSECGHFTCHAHVLAAFKESFMRNGRVTCPFQGCPYEFSHAELRKVVGSAEFEKANSQLNMISETGTEMVSCPKCKTTFLFEEGDIAANRQDSEGNKLSEAAAQHRARYRFRCPVCVRIACRKCEMEPYHDGRTCEEHKIFQDSKKCRYCDTVVGKEVEICDSEECRKRYQNSCKRILPCSHRCYGTSRDETCPPCLNEACHHEPDEHEYCNICYTEGLGQQPVVELECGHYLHSECLRLSLEKRWSGPRITFTYARCPLCKAWAYPKNHAGLREDVAKANAMFDQILARGLEQLRLDKEDANPRLSDPNDKNYYRQPERFAMDRFCFFECFTCKKWYYGGKKDCGQNDDGQKFEPKDLICPSCSAASLGGQASCPKHGADYIEFKCRFCCAVAAWFCWGTTHFCNDCHTKQNNKIYLNKMPRDQLPQCPGPAQCPLHIQHPPTGDEYPLGCALCRELA